MSEVNALFQVPKMSCGHCQSRIEGALTPLEGVAAMVVDLKNKAVTVTYDANVIDIVKLANVIEDAGYPVTASRKVA